MTFLPRPHELPWRASGDVMPVRDYRAYAQSDKGQSSQSAGACAVHRKTPRTESTTEGQHCRSSWPSSSWGRNGPLDYSS